MSEKDENEASGSTDEPAEISTKETDALEDADLDKVTGGAGGPTHGR